MNFTNQIVVKDAAGDTMQFNIDQCCILETNPDGVHFTLHMNNGKSYNIFRTDDGVYLLDRVF